MSAQLTYEFGADLDKLNLSINEATNLIKKFGKDAANSGQQDIGRLNAEILRLKDYIGKLQNIGLPSDLPNSTKKSTIALNDLNRVVQDLPFGFIAIQNNIPALAQSFSKLAQDNGGVKAGLKELASAFSGPAGITFAIGATVSALTSLVQKYGSLTTAFNQIFQIQPSLISLQRTYNEELSKSIGQTESEKTNLESLFKVYTDVNSSLNQRKGAYDLINQIRPEILSGISRETFLTNEQTAAVKERLKLVSQEIALKGQQQALQNLIAKKSEEYFKLNATISDGIDLFEGLGLIAKSALAGQSNAVAYIGNEFGNINKETKFYNTQLDLINAKLAEATGKVNDITLSEKERLKAQKEAAALALKAEREAEREAARRSKQSQKELLRIAKENAQLEIDIQNDKFKREDNAFKVLRDAYVSTLSDREQELYKIEEDYENKRSTLLRANIDDFASIEEEKLIRRKEVNDKYDKIALNDLDKASKERLRIQEEDGKAARKLFELSFVKQKGKSEDEEEQKRLQDNYIKTGKIIQSNLTAPLNELFDVILSKGQKSWQDFTKTILDSLKKLIVKLAIAAAIAAALSIISGGASNAANGGVNFKQAFGAILGIKLGGKGGGIANPGFGGINPGGMAMNGSVNLVLRGQDLVGSLNRTNSQLSRIG